MNRSSPCHSLDLSLLNDAAQLHGGQGFSAKGCQAVIADVVVADGEDSGHIFTIRL
jgi:hypothetical protein